MTIRGSPGRDNDAMRLRLLSPSAAAAALLAFIPAVLAFTPAVFGADGSTSGGAATDPVAGDPLLPYVVALLVAGVTLLIVGILVVVTGRGKPANGSRTRAGAGWWTCPACGAHNSPDRPDCYACMAPRDDGSGSAVSEEPGAPAHR